MSQVDGREPVRSASALGVRSQPLALLLLLCGGLLNVGGPQVSSQDELGERAQRTAAVRPPATSSLSEEALSCCRVSPVAFARRRRCEEGRRRARLGGCSRGEQGFGHSRRERWCREAAMVRPPSPKPEWGILMRLMWLLRGCRGADASGSGGGAGPSGRGCVIRAAQAAQCGRPEHAAAAAHAALMSDEWLTVC